MNSKTLILFIATLFTVQALPVNMVARNQQANVGISNANPSSDDSKHFSTLRNDYDDFAAHTSHGSEKELDQWSNWNEKTAGHVDEELHDTHRLIDSHDDHRSQSQAKSGSSKPKSSPRPAPKKQHGLVKPIVKDSDRHLEKAYSNSEKLYNDHGNGHDSQTKSKSKSSSSSKNSKPKSLEVDVADDKVVTSSFERKSAMSIETGKDTDSTVNQAKSDVEVSKGQGLRSGVKSDGKKVEAVENGIYEEMDHDLS